MIDTIIYGILVFVVLALIFEFCGWLEGIKDLWRVRHANTFQIYRITEDGFNKTYMGQLRAFNSSDALERFAKRRGFAGYQEMMAINYYPGMVFVSLKVTEEN